jgi:glyceraldehyde 3-phosphate dehydrogenase
VSLPVASLDEIALQRRLDDIGEMEGASARASGARYPVEMSTMRVGINGLGRIGRLALRGAFGAADRPADDPRAANRLDVVHVNEAKGNAAALAHLLEFDTVQGRWRSNINADANQAIVIGERRLTYSSHPSTAEVPWGDLGVDIVLECTGKFLTQETLRGHLERGAKRVIVAAPVKDDAVLNVVMGVNEHLYDPARPPHGHGGFLHDELPRARGEGGARGHRHPPRPDHHHPRSHQHQHVVDACTRTCAAPASAMLSLPAHHDRQRHRHRAHLSGAPGQAQRTRGARARAQRVADRLRVRAQARDHRRGGERPLRDAAKGPLAGILGFEHRPLVSADYARDTRSAIVDGPSTLVTDGTLLKVYAWYDNEMGYACRMVDLACHMQAVGI